MPKPETELLVINKMYDLVIWGCQRVAKFPRDRRYTLGDRLEGRLYSVLEELIEARYTADRVAILRHVNLQLELYGTAFLRPNGLFNSFRTSSMDSGERAGAVSADRPQHEHEAAHPSRQGEPAE